MQPRIIYLRLFVSLNMARVDLNSIGLLTVVAILSIVIYRRLLISSHPPAFTKPLVQAKEGESKTYRIRGVPITWNKAQLQTFLAEHDGCIGPAVKSLAVETHGRSQTGTITFQNGAQPPETLRGERSQPGKDGQSLVLDTRFLGLTTLFSPSPEDHQVE